MQIFENIKWKNMPSIQMENEMLRIVVLPGLGGKIASIYRKDLQFEAAAQNEKGIYDLPARGGGLIFQSMTRRGATMPSQV